MKRRAYRIGVFVATLIVILTIQHFFSQGGPWLQKLVEEKCKEQHIILRSSPFVLSFPASVKARDIGLQIPTNSFPIPLFVDQLDVSLRLLPLAWLSLSSVTDGTMYDGVMHLSYYSRAFSTKGSLHGELQNINLQKHPLLSAWNIEGKLNLMFDGQVSSDQRAPSFNNLEIQGKISDGAFGGLQNTKWLVPIPPAKDVSIAVSATIQNNIISLSNLSLSSSLGNVQGKGLVESLGHNNLKGKIRLNVALSDSGQQAFGGYLSLAAHRSLDSKVRSWLISVSFLESKLPNVEVTANE